MTNGQLDFLDLITLASFVIALQNLDENITQSDKADLQKDLSEKADMLLQEIHGHLEKQDALLSNILEELRNDNRRSIQ